jgi:tetratricopeptide (TPR) repeat protein
MFFSFRALLAGIIAANALVVFSTAAQAQVNDVIFTQSKKTGNRGIIPPDGMSAAEVTIDMAGLAKKFPTSDIIKIAYGEEPTDLTSARNLVVDKNYNSAKDQLAKIDASKVERDLIKQDIAYYKAFVDAKLALTEGGNKNDAASALNKFYKASPTSYHFFEAAETLGDLSVAIGRFDLAAGYYGDTGLGSAPWPEYKLKAGVLTGRALLLAGKFDDAAKAFDAVSASGETNPEANALKQHAIVGKAQCLAETGKADEGIAMLNDIVAKNDPQLDGKLFARAFNALGNCYLKQSKPKEALMAFLKTDLLFFTDSDAHAEALAKLAPLWEATGHADRATDARNKLKERYAGSSWATKL